MKKTDNKLNMTYYTHTFKNGLKAVFIPMDNKVSTNVSIALDVGNMHLYYKDRELLPGTAHFLEHLIFKEEDGEDGFIKITKETTSANAYTSLRETVYHYEILGDDITPLKTYLSILDNPYITAENVEKERDIILEEVKQSDNSPISTLYRLSDDALFHVYPDKYSVGGITDDVKKITKEDILFLYNNKYNNSNRTITVLGNFDYNKYYNFLKKYDASRPNNKHIKHITKKEGVTPNKKYVEVKSNYSSDYVSVSYKFYKSKDIPKYSEAMRRIFIYDIFFSKTSNFYQHLQTLGLFNSKIRVHLGNTDHLETITFIADTNKAKELIKEIDRYLFNDLLNDFDEELFESIKRAQIGQFLLGLDMDDFLLSAIKFRERHKIEVDTHLKGISEMSKEDVLNYFSNIRKDLKSVVYLKSQNNK